MRAVALLAGLLLLPGDPVGDTLAVAGLKRDRFRMSLSDINAYGPGPFRPALFEPILREPLGLPGRLAALRAELAQARGGADLVAFAARRLAKEGAPADAPAAPEGARPEGVEAALATAMITAGRPLEEADRDRALALLRKAPPAMQRAVERLLAAATVALGRRAAAFAELEPDALKELAAGVLAVAQEENADLKGLVKQLERVRWSELWEGARGLAAAAQEVADQLGKETFSIDQTLTVPTPIGPIVIGSTKSDRHEGPPPFLAIDPAGNDRYGEGWASSSLERPIGLVIDLSGNDAYASKLAPAFGAGHAGYGILIDRQGKDTYEAGRLSCGLGLLGVGLLRDERGDDSYRVQTIGEGAGLFGVGILDDVQGTDRYHTYAMGQGYGTTLGLGLLVDRAGNDRYEAEDTDLKNPSSQTKDHNVSLAQGFGFGRRDEKQFLAGGIGMLYDAAGDDVYSAGVFAQGAAYWFGLGFLIDAAGKDEYRGVWYVQGAAAHFGIGVLDDVAGNDTYAATMNMAQGAGHDLSLGFLLDEAGNDVYTAPNLSLGGGNDNGMGVFVDAAGNDDYRPPAAVTLGAARITIPERGKLPCFGLFLDLGGKDTYSRPYAGNNKTWKGGEGNPGVPDHEFGAGGDFEVKKGLAALR